MTATSHTSAALRSRTSALVVVPFALAFPVLLGTSCGDAGSSAAAGGSTGRGILVAAADDPIEFGAVGEFTLVDQAGVPFTQSALAGRVWVLSNIYTTCTGPCPSVTRTVGELQERLVDTDARLVSLSVDPALDTPPVLAAYAETHGADPRRWTFLTGSAEAVSELLIQRFLLPAARDDDAPLGSQVSHRSSLVVVDRAGRIRGYYDSQDPVEVDLLEERVRALLAKP